MMFKPVGSFNSFIYHKVEHINELIFKDNFWFCMFEYKNSIRLIVPKY